MICQKYSKGFTIRCVSITILIYMIHLIEKMNTTFCGPTILWMGIGWDFGGKGGIKSLRIFTKFSAVNRFSMPVPTAV